MSEGDRVLTEVRVKRRKIVQAVRASTEENAHKTVAIDQALYRYEAINLRRLYRGTALFRRLHARKDCRAAADLSADGETRMDACSRVAV